MQFLMNGKVYEVPAPYVDRLVAELMTVAEEAYAVHVDEKTQFGIGALARAYLVKLEMEVRAKYGKEAARAVRPPAKSDAALWLVKLFMPTVREALSHATITCETETESGTVTAFNVSIEGQGQAGGLVGIDGNAGQRQDNGTGVS